MIVLYIVATEKFDEQQENEETLGATSSSSNTDLAGIIIKCTASRRKKVLQTKRDIVGDQQKTWPRTRTT